ncbi:MAG TPA: MarR family winged helix-turn-helix transcriptional regulator [Pseudonocardiaceae bacterium]|nr:MarR family winged helix-turn-helix transcriptional regulator [Pseudonocardiaceae bacterium]
MGDETGVDERVSVLLARHGGVTTARIRDALAAIGYTPRQGTTLLRLAAEPGRMGQQALAETLCVDASVLVGILNDLEAAELVVRRRDPADRRRHIVAITAKGERAAVDVRSALDGVERELFADLDPSDVTRLHGLLSRVRTRPDDPACAE